MSRNADLRKLGDALWVAASPLSFLGVHVGTRMTVVRLSTGELWIHSPIQIDDDLKQAIDGLGLVRHIVAPNLYHHLFVGDAKSAWPQARIYGVAGLARKRKNISFDEELSETTPAEWQPDLKVFSISGTWLHECVFLHIPSRTLISSDLVENFSSSPHLWTRTYLKLMGIENSLGVSRLVRLCYRDKPAARASIDRILEQDFDRVIIAHGEVLDSGGPAAVREAYAWL